MTRVALEGIRVDYGGEAPALEVSELVASPGDVVAVLGASGSGKSTLLRAIAGFVRPSPTQAERGRLRGALFRELDGVRMRGSVSFDGEDVSHLLPRARNIAYSAQALNLYPHFTVFANLAFPLQMRGRNSSDVRSRIQAVADLLGLTRLLERRPGQLSGGEQQRVALGKALVQDARALLLDEPLSSLDGPMRAMLRQELRSWFQRSARTTFYVTHDLAEALALGDQVAVLEGGELLQVDSPSQLYQHPNSLRVAEIVWGGNLAKFTGRIGGEDGRLLAVNGECELGVVGDGADIAIGQTISIAVPQEAVSLVPPNECDPRTTLPCRVADVHMQPGGLVALVEGPGFRIHARMEAVRFEVGNEARLSLDMSAAAIFGPRDVDD